MKSGDYAINSQSGMPATNAPATTHQKIMRTPIHRLTQMLADQAKFSAYMPGNIIIDVTDDLEAAIKEIQATRDRSNPAEGQTKPLEGNE
jgi:hypothetical protein